MVPRDTHPRAADLFAPFPGEGFPVAQGVTVPANQFYREPMSFSKIRPVSGVLTPHRRTGRLSIVEL